MKKKLIEVALPLEAINKESAREKSIRHGHPSTLHLWWARRPLATCRAVLFSSLVDDPSSHPDKFPTEEEQEAERQRLFRIIEELVKWENINNEHVLKQAREEILKSTDGNPPPVYDPFCGGGSIPLEAQRLGLEALGSDLNPVAVLITKALVEIPPKFANRPPVNPGSRRRLGHSQSWHGTQGLAEDVRYYGEGMRNEAEKRIGNLYPKVKLPKEYGDGEAPVIAWLWAKTIRCPNPACGAHIPLVSSFVLSSRSGKRAWVEPMVDRTQHPPVIKFDIKTGKGTPHPPTKTGRGANFKCIACGQPAGETNIRAEFQAKRNSSQLMAIVGDSKIGRVYLPPTRDHVDIAENAKPKWKPEEEMNQNTSNLVSGRGYGIKHWHEIFTRRQLVALTTFSDLMSEAREKILGDAIKAGMPNVSTGSSDNGAVAYANAVATYLAFAVDRSANTLCTISRWTASREQTVTAFSRQALPMTWDYPDVTPFSGAAGDIEISINSIAKAIILFPNGSGGRAWQADATNTSGFKEHVLVSTDPPYHDNIGYADLSDFFYIWLRRSAGKFYSDLFSTMLVPKTEELYIIA